MYKIFDCSNSAERPAHRGGGGPIMNDIMCYLHQNAAEYNYEFIDSAYHADVIITNDVFPAEVIGLGKPLVKRMCGPFWQKEHSKRNDRLNAAARIADTVIFISEYSKRQYEHCYGNNLKSSCVVTHWVNPNTYHNRFCEKGNEFTFVATATDWARKEKRFAAIVELAKALPECNFNVIGTLLIKDSVIDMPNNIYMHGYLSPFNINYILNIVDGFINLSYRDACTKTVCQAINCGLPVLYANSGGVSEMVGAYGTAINDNHSLDMEDEVPELNINNMLSAYEKYRKDYEQIKIKLNSFDRKLAFKTMLDGYFAAITRSL